MKVTLPHSSTMQLPTSTTHLPKAPTGIQGLDEIIAGGLPKGRPTLITGGAGSGKTLLAMEFLVHGATQFDEPGVFVAFEESAEELTKNVASLGWDLADLAARKKLLVDFVYIEPSEIEETGEFDLEGLFIRLGHAIDSIGAKRVALDTFEALFGGIPNEAILRAEMRRLLRWLKGKGVTAVVTAERGKEGSLTRHGMEEYVSDAVIVLDHRVNEQIATRRLRVAKYRGATHGTNEYAFLIDQEGISVLPITSLGLDYSVDSERISTGIPKLDEMFGGKGFFRGSSVLVSGTAGAGKTSVAAMVADAACRRGERCVYFSFEESPSQIRRNMRSIALDLKPWEEKGLLRFHTSRPSLTGLEMHLVRMHRQVEAFDPSVVVIDPVSNMTTAGTLADVKSMLTRLIDFLKSRQITAVLTDLTSASRAPEQTESGISSLIDTWLLLRNLESNGERDRGLYILKSRGMRHSNQIREFLITDRGVDLIDVDVGAEGLLTGSARAAREAAEKAAEVVRRQEIGRKQREIETKRQAMEAKIAALRAEFEAEEEELRLVAAQDEEGERVLREDREEMSRRRLVHPGEESLND